MKIIKVKDIFGTERDVECPQNGFRSFRMLLASDGMGYTITKTVIPKGEPQFWHYKNHLESCFCVAGEGELTNLETGERFMISEDVMYVLDKNDPHTFEALTNKVVLICVFNPPLRGREVHMKDGSYGLEVKNV